MSEIFVNFATKVGLVKFNMGKYRMAAIVLERDFHLFLIKIDNNP